MLTKENEGFETDNKKDRDSSRGTPEQGAAEKFSVESYKYLIDELEGQVPTELPLEDPK